MHQYRSKDKMKDFILDSEWPAREVHLITGETGTGKTTLLTQWMNDLIEGKPVLGFPCEPQRVIYISNERSQESLELDNKGRWKLLGPFLTIDLALQGTGIKKIGPMALEAIIKKYCKDYDVIIVDPIVTFCPKPNDQNVVHEFLYNLAQRVLKKANVTILASGHPAKQKEGQKVLNMRTQVAGSQAWGSYSNCVMHLTFMNPDDVTDERLILSVKGRHSPPLVFHFERDEAGRLVELKKEDGKEEGKGFILSGMLEGKLDITFAEAVQFGKQNNISRATVARWVKKEKEGGRLIMGEEKGKFLVAPGTVQ